MHRLAALGLSLVPLVAAAQTAPTSTSGAMLTLLYTLVAAALLGLIGLLAYWSSLKAKDSKLWGLFNIAFLKAQAVVAHVEADIRPDVQRALADGQLSKEEAAILKARAIELFRSAAGDDLEQLRKELNLGQSTLSVFVSGLIERAVAAIKSSARPAGPPANP